MAYVFRNERKEAPVVKSAQERYLPLRELMRPREGRAWNDTWYSREDLEEITVPVAVLQSEYDEFIKLEHAKYISAAIPGADFELLSGVSHFAPLQRPETFNGVILKYLDKHSGIHLRTCRF